ncbi:MAG: putative ABC-type transport system, periplasmic component [Fibrobacteres bacterium]|nr:putative ABC-type transport system, periplasmic component [Fibrobacterota bacterium]
MGLVKKILLSVACMSLAVAVAHGAGTKVGYIYVGPKSDYGYNYAMDQGRLYVEKNMPGVKTVSFENVPENAEVERVMERMIKSGCTIIFPTSYGYLDPALNVAKKYPKVTFMHGGGFKTAPNLGTFFAGIDDAMYLAGITAGSMTKTKKLGFLAAHPIPQVLRNINAFTRGAQSVDPAITTTVVWTGTWSDPGKEAEAANSLVDAGADVLTGHVDSPITYTQTAEKRGVMAVGYHADASKFAPKGWLVGAAWNWGPMMAKIVKSVQDSTWKPEHIRGDLMAGDAGLTAFGPSVPAKVKDLVLAKEKEFKAGKTKLWTGPIVKQDGAEIAPKGTELAMANLEGMDFFVKGVVGTVK